MCLQCGLHLPPLVFCFQLLVGTLSHLWHPLAPCRLLPLWHITEPGVHPHPVGAEQLSAWGQLCFCICSLAEPQKPFTHGSGWRHTPPPDTISSPWHHQLPIRAELEAVFHFPQWDRTEVVCSSCSYSAGWSNISLKGYIDITKDVAQGEILPWGMFIIILSQILSFKINGTQTLTLPNVLLLLRCLKCLLNIF